MRDRKRSFHCSFRIYLISSSSPEYFSERMRWRFKDDRAEMMTLIVKCSHTIFSDFLVLPPLNLLIPKREAAERNSFSLYINRTHLPISSFFCWVCVFRWKKQTWRVFFSPHFDVIEVYIVLKFGLPPFSPPHQPHLCFCFYVDNQQRCKKQNYVQKRAKWKWKTGRGGKRWGKFMLRKLVSFVLFLLFFLSRENKIQSREKGKSIKGNEANLKQSNFPSKQRFSISFRPSRQKKSRHLRRTRTHHNYHTFYFFNVVPKHPSHDKEAIGNPKNKKKSWCVFRERMIFLYFWNVNHRSTL